MVRTEAGCKQGRRWSLADQVLGYAGEQRYAPEGMPTKYDCLPGVLLIVDAETMIEIGRAYVPISIPFGFHNRYFSKKDLGLPEGFQMNQVMSQFRPADKKVSFTFLE